MSTTTQTKLTNRYWIGPVENLGKMTQPGWCTKHCIADELDMIPYSAAVGTYFNSVMKGVILSPNMGSAFSDMNLLDWTTTGSAFVQQDVGIDTESGQFPTPFIHLATLDIDPSVVSTATSNSGGPTVDFVNNPTILLSLHRTELLPNFLGEIGRAHV